MNNNTKLFIDTIDSLASSQGSYGRMSQYIHEAINNDPSIIAKLDEELDELITDCFPEGLTETELNDILWFEPTWVLDNLGIEDDDDDELE